ncbi:MAG: hypothetical protein PVG69_06245, partial [Desulfobacterales bacterium]
WHWFSFCGTVSNAIICLSWQDCQGAPGNIVFRFREVARQWPVIISLKPRLEKNGALKKKGDMQDV